MKKIMMISVLLLSSSTLFAQTAFEANFKQAQSLCNQIYFPNSQAKSPGFDSNASLKKTEAQRDALGKKFASAEGVTFLTQKARSLQEKEDLLCVVDLLAAISKK